MDNHDYARKRRPPVLLEAVGFQYPEATTPTLHDVNLHVAAGEFVSVIGSSGAGKSTLLKLLTGQIHATRGRAVVAGLDLADITARRMPQLRRKIAVTFQEARLLEGRTAAENISYALELTGASTRKARTRAMTCLDLVGVAHLCDRYPRQMSGGEAQRVQIARAIANDPLVLLADEPTGSLDPDTTVGIIDCLASLADNGTAVVMVTHDVAAVDRLSRRVVALQDGTIADDLRGARYGDLTPAMGIPLARQERP